MCIAPQTYSYRDGLGRRCTVQGPCGQCIDCLKDYQNSWKIRLSEEFSETCLGVFCTLTYDPVNAPLPICDKTGEIIESDEWQKYCESKDNRPLSLRHEDVHAWVKRCREAFFYAKGKRPTFKYFFCGEYGPRTLRPHYHGFIVGINKNDFKHFFARDWQKRFGFVHVSQLRISKGKSPQRVANYVSKYCAKGVFENPRVKNNPDCFEKPRRSMSKGIGRAAALRLKSSILGDDFRDPYYTATGIHKDYGRTLFSEVLFSHNWDHNHVLEYEPSTFVRISSDLPRVGERGIHYRLSAPPRLVQSFSVRKRRRKDQIVPDPVEIRYSLPYKTDFLDKVIDSLKVTYQDYEKHTSFTYKLPRYFRTIVLGEKSPLAVQCQERISERFRRDYSEKLAELQASHPLWSDLQAVRFLEMQANSERAVRAERTYKTLNKFYQQSKV